MEEPGGTPSHENSELESTDSNRLSGHTRLGQLLLRIGEQKYHIYTTVFVGRFEVQMIGIGMDESGDEKDLESPKNNVGP